MNHSQDDPSSRKLQRAMKRARGKYPEEQTLEPGERHQRTISITKRRTALSVEDTEKQICSYFDSN